VAASLIDGWCDDGDRLLVMMDISVLPFLFQFVVIVLVVSTPTTAFISPMSRQLYSSSNYRIQSSQLSVPTSSSSSSSSSSLIHQIRKRGKIRLPTTTTARWSTLEESTTSSLSTAEITSDEQPPLVDLDGRIVSLSQSNATSILRNIDIASADIHNINVQHEVNSLIEIEEDGVINADIKENITSAGVHRTDRYSRTIFDRDGKTNNNDEEDLPRKELDLNITTSSLVVGPAVPISFDDRGWVQADYLASLDSDYPELIKLIFQKDENGRTLATKLFNAALLAASFGYVFYTVFNIDKGMTRGWSPAEITMRIPLDTWASYENSLSEKPVATKTIINIVIYLLGDWLSQTLFQKKDILNFDAGRTIKNGFVGMCFGPVVHEYYEFSDWILPVEGLTIGITNRAFKILMDQTIYLSVKCSIYIIAIAVLNGESVESGADNVKNRLKPIMFTAWKFWPLVHCVTYGLIPARHRILWVNSVDLVWNAILASKARGDDNVDDENDDVSLEDNDDNRQDVEMKDSSEGGGGLDNIFQRLGSRLSSLNSSPQDVDRGDPVVIEEHIVTFNVSSTGEEK